MRATLSRRLAALEIRTERQVWEAALLAGIPEQFHADARRAMADVTEWDRSKPGALPVALSLAAVRACPDRFRQEVAVRMMEVAGAAEIATMSMEQGRAYLARVLRTVAQEQGLCD